MAKNTELLKPTFNTSKGGNRTPEQLEYAAELLHKKPKSNGRKAAYEGAFKTTTLRIGEEVYNKMKQKCFANDMTMAEYIHSLIEKDLEKENK